MKTARCARVATAMLATSALAAPAFAQAPKAPLEARVDRLETLLQGVIDRLDRQQGASLTPAEGQAVREARGVLAERSAVTGSITSRAAAAPGTATASATPIAPDQRASAQASGFAGRLDALEKGAGLGFRVGGSTIKIGGYFKFDANVSRYGGGESAPEAMVRYYYAPAGIPVGGRSRGSETQFNARETRFSINTETPIGDEKLNGVLELDFLDTPLIGNERVANSYVPRVRLAYLSYGNWLLGQAWTTFQNVATLPERTDFLGPTEGIVFNRQAMIRYTNGGLQIAIEQPETTVQVGATSIEASNDKAPDVVVRYNFKGDWGTAAIAGIGRYLNYNDGVIGGVDDNAFGYGVSASGIIKVGATDNFNFMITGGKGIGRYMGLNIRDDVVVAPRNQIETVGVASGFASYRHFWTPKWRSVLTGSYYQAFNPAAAGFAVTDNVYSGTFETFYSPIKPVTFGVGYRYARRELDNGISGDLNRLQFSAQYNF